MKEQIEILNNIIIGKGTSPKDFDFALTSIDSKGNPGQLNLFVMEELGYSSNILEKLDLSKGFHLLDNGSHIPIIFVVTIDSRNYTGINLKTNLNKAIKSNLSILKSKKVWVPLMGTGSGQLTYQDSYDTIKGVLKNYTDILFTVSVPDKLDLDELSGIESNSLGSHEENPQTTKSGIDVDSTLKGSFKTVSGSSKKAEHYNRFKEKVPFQLDQVVDEDKLGREPVAKAFANLIKDDVFTDKLNHSFIVHLQGEWGAGKSSFLNFIAKHLNSGGGKWIIVTFNAWQNQHINPPWWSFIDQVYRQAKYRLHPIFIRPSLVLSEKFRRIIWYSGWPKIVAFLICIVLGLIFYWNYEIFFESVSNLHENNEKFDLSEFFKFLIGISTIVGLVYSFSKFITTPLFINNSDEAKSFMVRASDPLNKISQHFDRLIADIKGHGYEVAIFIDDIDRCNKEYIVSLLEGIQTLFKDKRVLYIIAGDKNWITTSFANTYSEFANKIEGQKQLGEFFLEKAFQLSIRLPNISEEHKRNYWNSVLGMPPESEKQKVDSLDKLLPELQHKIKNELNSSKSELTNPEFVERLQSEYNLSVDAASSIVIEEKNKDTNEIKHLLEDYHRYIDTNPRSIVRLANNYMMERSTLMAERVLFNEEKLFRWLVIEDLCPNVKSILKKTNNIEDLKLLIKNQINLKERENCLILLEGDGDFIKDKIDLQDIYRFKGLQINTVDN